MSILALYTVVYKKHRYDAIYKRNYNAKVNTATKEKVWKKTRERKFERKTKPT